MSLSLQKLELALPVQAQLSPPHSLEATNRYDTVSLSTETEVRDVVNDCPFRGALKGYKSPRDIVIFFQNLKHENFPESNRKPSQEHPRQQSKRQSHATRNK
eukprot:scaffold1115_cov112-Skeletonema_marinoi.AAC.5